VYNHFQIFLLALSGFLVQLTFNIDFNAIAFDAQYMIEGSNHDYLQSAVEKNIFYLVQTIQLEPKIFDIR